MACAGAGRRYGGAPALVAPAPRPDEMAAQCAKLDAPVTAVASHEQLELLADLDDPEGQRLEFDLGLAYYCLGLYSEALAVFVPGAPRQTTSARMGPEIGRAIAEAQSEPKTRMAYPPTLRLLVSLYRRFPGRQGAENAVAASSAASYEAPELADIRAELLYMAARAAYSAGQFPRALDLLGQIPATSVLYVRAKLLQGAARIRTYEAKHAVDAFREALRATTFLLGPEDAVRFRDLANISLARTFYSTGQFDLAAKYYAAVPPESPYWRERLFEGAWTEYMRGNYSGAVQGVSALRSYADPFGPELMGEATLLQSAAALEAGDRRSAAAVFDVFNATYPQLLIELKMFLATNPNDGAIYARVAALRRGRSDLPPALEPVARDLLANALIGRRFDDIDELTREIAGYERLPATWRTNELAGSVSEELTARLSVAINEAGSLFRRRIRRTVAELALQIKRTIHIEYEPLKSAVAAPAGCSPHCSRTLPGRVSAGSLRGRP
jgi:tetratricopeptide (TPR) repeat protein